MAKFTGTEKVKLLVSENPKRPSGKSYKRFNLYKNGMTVAAYCEAAAKFEEADGNTARHYMKDIKWDIEHGFIEVK